MDRPMILAEAGWYSDKREICQSGIESLINSSAPVFSSVKCAVLPHAGYRFSGRIAVNGVRMLHSSSKNVETVVIFGGHMPSGSKPVVETFDAARTPFGELQNDKTVQELLGGAAVRTNWREDNTAEIFFPIIKYFFGDVKIAVVYVPADGSFVNIAEKLSVMNNTLFIGSTDLTHYGGNYGFTPDTGNLPPHMWLKNQNDKSYLELLNAGKLKESIEYAEENRSACSAGAAAAAGYVAQICSLKPHLFDYYTSYDIMRSDNIVGYAGIIYGT